MFGVVRAMKFKFSCFQAIVPPITGPTHRNWTDIEDGWRLLEMIWYVLISIREMTATINIKCETVETKTYWNIECRLATSMNQPIPIVLKICHVISIMASHRPRDMGRIQRLTSVCMDAPTLPTDTVRENWEFGPYMFGGKEVSRICRYSY